MNQRALLQRIYSMIALSRRPVTREDLVKDLESDLIQVQNALEILFARGMIMRTPGPAAIWLYTSSL